MKGYLHCKSVTDVINIQTFFLTVNGNLYAKSDCCKTTEDLTLLYNQSKRFCQIMFVLVYLHHCVIVLQLNLAKANLNKLGLCLFPLTVPLILMYIQILTSVTYSYLIYSVVLDKIFICVCDINKRFLLLIIFHNIQSYK